jgi:hypothetical protein
MASISPRIGAPRTPGEACSHVTSMRRSFGPRAASVAGGGSGGSRQAEVVAKEQANEPTRCHQAGASLGLALGARLDTAPDAATSCLTDCARWRMNFNRMCVSRSCGILLAVGRFPRSAVLDDVRLSCVQRDFSAGRCSASGASGHGIASRNRATVWRIDPAQRKRRPRRSQRARPPTAARRMRA